MRNTVPMAYTAVPVTFAGMVVTMPESLRSRSPESSTTFPESLVTLDRNTQQLLELSKPPLPKMKSPKHYLLATPFRYRPQHQSRFRRAGTLGVWYGAEELYAACAEVAYWRHRFILDSVPLLQTELLTEHTFFQAEVKGKAVDLMSPPWVQARAAWTHGSDYAETHAVAGAAKDVGVQWICYESVRALGKRCAAVLDVEALEMREGTAQQTWHCKATRATVSMVHQTARYDWTF